MLDERETRHVLLAKQREVDFLCRYESNERRLIQQQMDELNNLFSSRNSNDISRDIDAINTCDLRTKQQFAKAKISRNVECDLFVSKENSFHWLSCLGNNALLSVACDVNLHETMNSFSLQHSSIDSLISTRMEDIQLKFLQIEASSIEYSNHMKTYASDFLLRQQCLLQAFQEYTILLLMDWTHETGASGFKSSTLMSPKGKFLTSNTLNLFSWIL